MARRRDRRLVYKSVYKPPSGVNPHFAYVRAIGHGHARVVALLPLLAPLLYDCKL
jgi:hypothetical protein